ncbi:MAG: sigma-70 family RNA polymerase sigma factor [Bacteroidales bacterium]|nr:sigma-70 family RNA polymerase sigma factor [Bacteroidales bacterium]
MENEHKLIKQLRRGNEAAYRHLIENHKQMVYLTAYGFLHNQTESEDIAQEVFAEVFRSVHKFKGDSKLSTWLYRITVNKSINELKKLKRMSGARRSETSFQPEDNEVIEVEDISNHTPDKIQENQERKTILENAINELPENQKTAFVLHKYDQLPYKKIAEIMESSLSSVESLIHRAKLNLQKKLIHYYKS